MTKIKTDWTMDSTTGRSNSSPVYIKLSAVISRIIKNSAHDLLTGKVEMVGELILSKLAHEHGMRPSEEDMSLLRDLEPIAEKFTEEFNKKALASVITERIREMCVDIQQQGYKPTELFLGPQENVALLVSMTKVTSIVTGSNQNPLIIDRFCVDNADMKVSRVQGGSRLQIIAVPEFKENVDIADAKIFTWYEKKPQITCLADIERLVAENVEKSGKPGPRIVTIGMHTRQVLQALQKDVFGGGTLHLQSGQTIIIRLHHAEQFLSIQRIREEKEEVTHTEETALCWFCKVRAPISELAIISELSVIFSSGAERGHTACARTWYELTVGEKTEALCAILHDFYYTSKGKTDLTHYEDGLPEKLLIMGLIYKNHAGQYSAYYITDLGSAFYKKVLIAPWYKPTTLQAQVDRLALYAVSKGLTPAFLLLGQAQYEELYESWLTTSKKGTVLALYTSGGPVEIMYLSGHLGYLGLNAHKQQTQEGVKEYPAAITLETIENQTKQK